MEILRKNQKEVLEINQKQTNKKTHWHKIEYAFGWIIDMYVFKSMKMTIYCLEKGKHDSKQELKLIIREQLKWRAREDWPVVELITLASKEHIFWRQGGQGWDLVSQPWNSSYKSKESLHFKIDTAESLWV